jgi:hypothetical protein
MAKENQVIVTVELISRAGHTAKVRRVMDVPPAYHGVSAASKLDTIRQAITSEVDGATAAVMDSVYLIDVPLGEESA